MTTDTTDRLPSRYTSRLVDLSSNQLDVDVSRAAAREKDDQRAAPARVERLESFFWHKNQPPLNTVIDAACSSTTADAHERSPQHDATTISII